MGEPEPLVPKPRQNTGHLPAADNRDRGRKRNRWRRCASGALSQGDLTVRTRPMMSDPCEIAVRPLPPQLLHCREVDSISSSATDWCVEVSCSTVGARYAGCATARSRRTAFCIAPLRSHSTPAATACGRGTNWRLVFLYRVCFTGLLR